MDTAEATLAASDHRVEALRDSLGAASAPQRPVLEARLKTLEARQAAEVASLAELRNQAKDAATLGRNLQVLGEHFIALFIVGFIAGVLMAQVSGAVFLQRLLLWPLQEEAPGREQEAV